MNLYMFSRNPAIRTYRQIRYEASSAYYKFCAFHFSLFALNRLEHAYAGGLLGLEPWSNIEVIEICGLEAGCWCYSIDDTGYYYSKLLHGTLARMLPAVRLVRVVGDWNLELESTYGERDIVLSIQQVILGQDDLGVERVDLEVCFEKDY
jgi:hypothetical protein